MSSAAPPRPSRRWRVVRVTVLAAIVCGLGPVAVVQGAGQSAVRDDVEAVAPASVALVLGAGLQPDGTPSVFLGRRLERARALYEAGRVQVILVSGDNSRVGYDEPSAMRTWLLDHGVPDARIVRDYAGFDTHDTCVRARKVFGVRDAVVVTQDYHLRRALFSCRAAGIEVQGQGVSSASVEPAKAIAYRVREVPASAKAAWDALTGREPVHLGARETSVDDALAAAAASEAAAGDATSGAAATNDAAARDAADS